MSQEITEAMQKQYHSNYEHLYEQSVSQLRKAVRSETQAAEAKFWNFIGSTSGTWHASRHEKTVRTDTPHSRRKCTLAFWSDADWVDEADLVQVVSDPTSPYLKARVASANRATDEKILEALGGTAYTGKEGTTAVANYALDECRLIDGQGTLVTAGSNHSDSTATHLTVAKVALMGQLMDDANVPENDRYIVTNPYNKWKFLQESDVKTYDVNTVKALAAGTLPEAFMGFHFIWLPTDRFAVEALNTTNVAIDCYAFHKSAMLLSIGKEIGTKIDRLPDYNYSIQGYVSMMIGAVRLQGPGVIEIVLLKG